MTYKPVAVPAYQKSSAGQTGLSGPASGKTGYRDSTTVARAKVDTDGSVLSAAPSVGAAPNGPGIVAVSHDGAGAYTVTLTDQGQTAAQVAPSLTCNTAGLVGSAVVTDATHIAVATKTDAGVATDSIFTLAVDFLN